MFKRFVAVAFALALLAGPFAFESVAQGTQSPPPASKMPAAKAAAPAMPAQQPQAASDEPYPPCSRTLHDHCLEMTQPGLNKAYPACARIKNATDKAACVEGAYKNQKG